MSERFEALKESFPDYAKDIKLNLGNILSIEGSPDLTEGQIWGNSLAATYSTANQSLISAIEDKAKTIVSEEVFKAAKAAATIMAMNNVYYRFVHLLHDEEISKMPAKLRMNVIGNPGIPRIDFELMSLAVSAINGCGLCIESHSKQLEEHGVTKIAIQSTAKIAAVIKAAAQALEIS